jgi:hypothetical protein
MKKIIYTFYLITATLSLTSCLKDLGNYDYTQNEVITITGMEDSYIGIQGVDSLTITPTVTSNIPGADFEYCYIMYETSTQGYWPTQDTIQGSGKDLVKYPISCKSMTYALVFIAKNKTTGVTGFVKSTLNVVTKFNDGWYVIKDASNVTDIDLFDNTGKLLVQNVLLSINGRQLKGKAQALNFVSNYNVYDNVLGRFVSTKTIFPVSDIDAKAVELSTATIVKNYGEMFYDKITEPYAPGFFFGTMAGFWTINQGRAYGIFTFANNVGVFGAQAPIDANYSAYHLSKYSVNHMIYGPLCYDEITCSFVVVPYSGTQMAAAKSATNSEMPASRCNNDLIYMGSRGIMNSYFFAVMQDRDNPAVKFISKVEGHTSSTSPSLKFTNDTLSVSDPAYNATLYTSNQSMDILYFVSNNHIYKRNVASKGATNIQLGFDPPAGETVTFIKHYLKYSTYLPDNLFIVGTQSAGKYKVRMFVINTIGDINTTPIRTFEGNGRAADVLLVFPNLSNNNFPVTY